MGQVPVDVSRHRDWLRGLLDVCVLAVLAQGDRHGYGIARELERVEVGTVKGGTLYPLLARLEADGSVTSSWDQPASGPARKTYALTAAGHQQLGQIRRDWCGFVDRVAALVTDAPCQREAAASARRD